MNNEYKPASPIAEVGEGAECAEDLEPTDALLLKALTCLKVVRDRGEHINPGSWRSIMLDGIIRAVINCGDEHQIKFRVDLAMYAVKMAIVSVGNAQQLLSE